VGYDLNETLGRFDGHALCAGTGRVDRAGHPDLFGDWWLGKDRGVGWEEAVPAYLELGYWLWLALMACGQALLLFAPVGIAERRLTPRRPLLVPVITASFFLANLFLAGMLSVLCILFKTRRWICSRFLGNSPGLTARIT